MNLDDGQKQKISAWLEDGLKLADIQKKLAAEFGVQVTYMELRFLLDDLKLKPKEVPVEAPKLPPAEAVPENKLNEEAPPAPSENPAALGSVSMTVDQIARPGALVSGNVTFSDGMSAQWLLDQTGRIGLVAKQQGYKPSQEDLMTFQTELQNQLAKLGF